MKVSRSMAVPVCAQCVCRLFVCFFCRYEDMSGVCLVIYGESHGMAPRFSWGLRMRVFISRRSRRAAWERGAAVRAQHDTSLSTEQDSGCTQGHEGLPGSHEAPLHLKPEQIWVLKQELDCSSFACTSGVCCISSSDLWMCGGWRSQHCQFSFKFYFFSDCRTW